MKSYVMEKKKKLPQGTFIRLLEKKTKQWLAYRLHPQLTERQKRGRVLKAKTRAQNTSKKPQQYQQKPSQKRRESSTNPDLATEKWSDGTYGKRKRREGLRYFPAEKAVGTPEGHSSNDVDDASDKREQDKSEDSNSNFQQNGVNVTNENDESDYDDLFADCPSTGLEDLDDESFDETVYYNRDGSPGNKKTYNKFSGDIKDRFFDQDMRYPVDFPFLSRNIAGLWLNEQTFKRLMPTKALDGEIINAFLSTLTDVAAGNDLKLLPFDSYFCEKMVDTHPTIGFFRWIQTVQPTNYDVWLIPYNAGGNHWTLLAAILPAKLMIYFDSLHGEPPKNFIENITGFIIRVGTKSRQKTRGQSQKEWELFIPRDIPQQKSIPGMSANNCGVHVCMYAYMIASGSSELFEEADMNAARIGIANYLFEFPFTESTERRLTNFDALLESDDILKEMKRDPSMRCVHKNTAPYGSTSQFLELIRVRIDGNAV
ncbi:uncharacterized protein LOC107037462 [Diachasma alloeum]|uniref:uncharacterized protein LOC107037462 n=1 Tax=Diachasma alloeum TaxID=454923 RepID=UPI00073839FE|nr:uncharacterized protein LOC107037462 [Diachasma alloeum]